MHVPGAVHLPLQPFRACRRGVERPLLPDEDVEEVVREVHARVPLRADRRAEDEEVLGEARVHDVHRAHRPARVAQHPLGAVQVQRDAARGVFGGEVRDDVGDDGVDVVGVLLHGCLGEGVQVIGVQDVPAVLWVVEGEEGLEEVSPVTDADGRWMAWRGSTRLDAVKDAEHCVD